MRLASLLPAAILCAAAMPAPAADPVAPATTRLSENRQAAAEAEARSRAVTKQFMAITDDGALLAQAESGGVFAATQAAAVQRGRQRTLEEWLEKGRGRGGADWLRQRAERLNGGIQSLTLSEDNLKASVTAGLPPFSAVIALERLYAWSGYAEGVAAELALISRESGARDAAPLAEQFQALAETLRQRQAALRQWTAACSQTDQTLRCGQG